jgi:hypothetical protein
MESISSDGATPHETGPESGMAGFSAGPTSGLGPEEQRKTASESDKKQMRAGSCRFVLAASRNLTSWNRAGGGRSGSLALSVLLDGSGHLAK